MRRAGLYNGSFFPSVSFYVENKEDPDNKKRIDSFLELCEPIRVIPKENFKLTDNREEWDRRLCHFNFDLTKLKI